MTDMKGTTVLTVRKDGKVAMAADGQVTIGSSIMKANARKIRSVQDGKVIAGFAGSTADAFTLFSRFEDRLKEFSGELTRAVVELAKDWRSDKVLRRLEAFMLVADRNKTFLLSGMGDVLEPESGICAIGSGGNYAYAAACAFLEASSYDARSIAERSLHIAADICIYTNKEIVIEELI